MKQNVSRIVGFILLIGICIGVYWIAGAIWEQIKSVKPEISVGIFSASATIIVAVLTVVVGSQIEKRREIEAHFRDEKLKIYDEFLREFFGMFNDKKNHEYEDGDVDEDLVDFLRDWQRKMIIWGGQDVLLKYIQWKRQLQKGVPDAR